MKIVLRIGVFVLLSNNAYMLATLGVTNVQGNAVQIQSDNKIIVAGTVTRNNVQQLMLARYTPFGTIDTLFGDNGYVATPIGINASAYDVALLNNDKALVVGSSQSLGQAMFTVARYNKDGTLDTTFNNTGIVTRSIGTNSGANGVSIATSGNYLVGGTSIIGGAPIMTVASYHTNGTIDPAFGNSGIAIKRIFSSAGANAIALQSSGKIVMAGFTLAPSNIREFGLVRFTEDGALDTSFGGSGTVATAIGNDACAYATAIQSNNHIIAAGIGSGKFALVRYGVNGALDSSFGLDGIVTTAIGASSQINDVIIQTDGKIIAVGFSDSNIAIARYNINGFLDVAFGLGGIVTTQIGNYSLANSVALQSNGQIVVAGISDNGTVVVRYNSNGSLDSSFGNNGVVNFPNDYNAPDIFEIANINIADNAQISYGKLNLTNSITNSDISSNAAISDAKLAPIASPGSVLNTATTATSSNIAGTIVARDTLGDFNAHKISADLVGTVNGKATQNVLKSGDTMTGSLVLPAGTFVQPSLQFDGSLTTGLSAHAGSLSLSTQGAERVTIDTNGALFINAPVAGNALTIDGGGASIEGDISSSGNIIFNTSSLDLNSIGSTQGPFVKIFSGVANTGFQGQVSLDYQEAGFINPPVICANPTSGASVTLTINFITNKSALITSVARINVPFNYIAIGI